MHHIEVGQELMYVVVLDHVVIFHASEVLLFSNME